MKKSYLSFVAILAPSLFEGEGSGGATSGNTGSGATGGNTGSGATSGNTGSGGKTHTQEELNAILARERKAFTDKIQEATRNLEMTEETRKALEAQLEETRSASLTEKERLAKQLKKAEEEAAAKLTAANESAKTWQTRFTSSQIQTGLTQASIKHDAYNPEQIHAILAGKSRVVEDLGADGKPNGNFSVKTKVLTLGSDGKPVELEMSPDEAVKALKETKEFMNLFKGTQVPGLGSQNGSGNKGGPIDVSGMSHDQYMKMRKENPTALHGRTTRR